MLDNDPNNTDNASGTGPEASPEPRPESNPPQGRPESRPESAPDTIADIAATQPVKKAAAKKAAKAPAKKAASKRTTAKKAAGAVASETDASTPDDSSREESAAVEQPKKKAPPRKRAAKLVAAPDSATDSTTETSGDAATSAESAPAAPMVLFKAPEPATAPPRKRTTRKVSAKPAGDQPSGDQAAGAAPEQAKDAAAGEATAESADDSAESAPERGSRGQGGRGRGGQGGNRGGRSGQGQRGKGSESAADGDAEAPDTDQDDSDDDSGDGEGGARRRRRRGGRRRRKPSDGEDGDNAENQSEDSDDSEDSEGDNDSTGSRRRRRRRRTGDDGDGSGDSENSTPRARKQRNPEDEITSIGGSTRLEAKKQRRREGREAGRRRAPIVSEAEFLARREAVDRVMVIRQKDDLTQIGVLEDTVLVEHYVARESQTSLIGNVYLGRVQNVLPSMEAAFIDIGKGRNAVLYAGEVNWSAVGHKEGQPRKIESVLSSGQTILVQVSKDPVGHKGARLTGQVSLPGRFLVYVPDGNTSGISRKLPDTERNRLKTLLKQIVPDSAGVIVRTAAEGASEEELTLDVERLTARWAAIEEKVKAGKSPQMLYGEPDLTLKVVRDLFTEDFAKLVVQGDDAWNLVEDYVSHVAPDLQERLERFEPGESGPGNKSDLFATYRVDEQIAKGLDRKVWLPSGGSLIIDRTEAMTVVDVNTGKFTGSGGNLEETVTKNNLEAAEEMVRQLRLRDIGGIIVVDFIDMVLESNRDLVMRRLVECLGRDRTRHQVAEVTSLGLVQMTRKRIGTGLLEAFSTDCEHCKGRGLVVHEHPVESGARPDDDDSRGRGRGRGGRNRGRGSGSANGGGAPVKPSPADLAKSRPPEKVTDDDTAVGPELDVPEATPAVGQQQVEQSVVGTVTEPDHEPQHVPTETIQTSTGLPAESPVESPVETPAEAPRVITSTRRRTARRPAGPPSPLSEAASTSDAGDKAGPSAEPVQIPVGTAPQGDPMRPSDGPDRPDGPEDALDGGEAGDEAGNANSLVHVPIKRKGSRKR